MLAQPCGRSLAIDIDGVAAAAFLHLVVPSRGFLGVLVEAMVSTLVGPAENAARVLRPQRGRYGNHADPASVAALNATSVDVGNSTRGGGRWIPQVRRPLEPHEGLGRVLLQPSRPITVREAQPPHCMRFASLCLRPKGRHLRLVRHPLLPCIRLGAADDAALHKACERVADLHGQEEPFAHRLVSHGRLDLRLRLPIEPFLDGAPLVDSTVLRRHRINWQLESDGAHVLVCHLVDDLLVALVGRLALSKQGSLGRRALGHASFRSLPRSCCEVHSS
eukprot:scaffold27699_cov63-Phaeocystis_antarctica.AAC.10